MNQQKTVEIKTWEELAGVYTTSMAQKSLLKEDYPNTVVIFNGGIELEVYFQDAFIIAGLLPQFEVSTKRVKGFEFLEVDGQPIVNKTTPVVFEIPMVTFDHEQLNEIVESLTKFVPVVTTTFENQQFVVENSFEVSASAEVSTSDADETEISVSGEDDYQLVAFYLQESLGMLLIEKNSGNIITQKTNFAGIFTFVRRYAVSEVYLYLGKAWEQEALQQVLDLRNLPQMKTVEVISVQYFLVRDQLHAFQREHFDRNNFSYVEVCAFYYYQTQVLKGEARGFNIQQLDPRTYLDLNDGALSSLDVFETNAGLSTKTEGTIFGLLDRCITQQGSRLVKKSLQEPLRDPSNLTARYAAVDYFLSRSVLLEKLQTALSESMDADRLFDKWTKSRLKEDEVVDLFETLDKYNEFLETLIEVTANHGKPDLNWLSNAAPVFKDKLIEEVERLSAVISPDDFITEGFNEDFDAIRAIYSEVQTELTNFHTAQIEATAIKNLKIAKNENIGIHFEVTKTGWAKVDESWILLSEVGNKRTYHVAELTEIAKKLSAVESAYESALRKATAAASTEITSVTTLKEVFEFISLVDMLLSFASVSAQYGFVRPRLVDNVGIQIKNGRHPLMQTFSKRSVIENDFEMLNGNVYSLFGGNTSGKSTYLKMIASNILLAQVGCFVPASSMAFTPVDRIFMRSNKHDILLKGKSSFRIEMEELSYILHHATQDSLILLDEIGSATNPVEGAAIAISTVEYIAQHLGTKAVCSTHFENVAQLEATNENIRNLHMEMYLSEGQLRSTYRVALGASNDAKGREVAQMAYLPIELMDNINARLGK